MPSEARNLGLLASLIAALGGVFFLIFPTPTAIYSTYYLVTVILGVSFCSWFLTLLPRWFHVMSVATGVALVWVISNSNLVWPPPRSFQELSISTFAAWTASALGLSLLLAPLKSLRQWFTSRGTETEK